MLYASMLSVNNTNVYTSAYGAGIKCRPLALTELRRAAGLAQLVRRSQCLVSCYGRQHAEPSDPVPAHDLRRIPRI